MKSHFEAPRQLRMDPGIVCCKTCGRSPDTFGGGGYSGRSCRACSDNEKLLGNERTGTALKIHPKVMETKRRYWEGKTCEAIRRDKAARSKAT